MGTNIAQERISDSCRCDWWSGSYRSAHQKALEDTLAYFRDAAAQLAGQGSFREGSGRRFFSHSVQSADAGVLIRWSNFGDKINAGCISVDLQGAFWSQTVAEERKALFLDAVELPGFRKCTRFDAQRTVVDPQANSEQIWTGVRKRELWVAGYNSHSQLSPVDSKGDAVNGASTVWGKPTAAVRLTTYNKALEQKIRDQNAVRHEARCRGAAAEGYFDALMNQLQTEDDAESGIPTNAENTVVRSILRRHMNYLDTSRYSHIEDKAQWPKNWAKKVHPADFMGEVLEGDFTEVKPATRFGKKLAERKAHADHQYGSTYALWLLQQTLDTQQDMAEVMDAMLDHWFIRLKDEHLDELQKATHVQREWLENYINGLRRQAAHNLELGER